MSNGKNGDRIANICKSNRINHIVIPVERKALEEAISTTDNVKGVCVVHCEASTGKVNPVKEIAEAVKEISEGEVYILNFCSLLRNYLNFMYLIHSESSQTNVFKVVIHNFLFDIMH